MYGQGNPAQRVVIVKTNRQTWNWITDAILLIGFVVAFFLDLTGLFLHQWLGVALVLFAGYHLLSHWDWVKSVARRFWGQTSKQACRYFLVDAGLMLGFALILATGLVISSWFALPLENYAAWENIHVAVSIATLLIVVGKIGLHWRWIIKTARRFFPTAPAVTSLPVQPIPVSGRMDRRSFLTLMGAVGVTAVIAIGHVLDDEKSVSNESATLSLIPEGTSQANKTYATSSANTLSSGCVVRCNRGCSYPGHCRRYVDTNGNNRCDMGECL
jgi:hypothetical protein